MGETPFLNPVNDEDSEPPGERAQRLHEEQSGLRQPAGDAGPTGQIRRYDPELGMPDAQPDAGDEPDAQ